ncbi:Ig-like domain-containing protein [Ectopseudomonas mendocina]|uniref:Ig-like domain-containing protein n=1 Tax=Ectopseudomonas mendocina TaxID=300 RepID=A0ABZ2RDP1_ECTME
MKIQSPSIVTIAASPADIGSISREGNSLVIKLKSGEVITLTDFFVPQDGMRNDLVIDDTPAQGGFWWAEYDEPWDGVQLVQVDSLESLMGGEEGWGVTPLLLLGGAGAAGVAAAAGGGGGSSHSSAPVQDVVAPDSPVIKFNNKHGLTGTSEANATITLYRPDGSTVVTQADKNGLWHFNPNPMGEGEEGYVSATDASSNESGKTATGPADVTAPDAPHVNSNNSHGLAGSSEAGATVTVIRPDGSTATTQVDEQGNWLFKPNPLFDGEQGRVSATDKAGNEGAYAETGTADLSVPEPPVIDTNNGGGLGGSGEPGGVVVVERPDGSTVTTIVDEDGNWTIKPNPLEEGEKGSVTITDPSGNISEPSETGEADFSAPDAPLVLSNNAVGLAGTAEAGSTVTLVRADGSSVTTNTDSQGNWSMSPNPLTDGSSGHVTATDASGNTSARTSTGIADLLAPDTPLVLTNNANGLGGLAEAGSNVTLLQKDGSSITVQADESGRWQIQPNPLADQSEGTLTATDVSGNVSLPGSTGLADLLAPDIPRVECNNLDGLIGTGEQGCIITLIRPDGSTVTAIVDADGKWMIQPNPLEDCEEGTVNATDPNGNKSGDGPTGAADMTPAEPPQVEYNNASGLGGIAEAGGTITVTLNDGSTVTTTVDQAGNWELQPNPLVHGENATITLTDPGRNVSPLGDTGVADLLAPDAPVISSNNGEGLVGAGEPGSTVLLELSDGSTLTTVVDEQGQWAFVPNPLNHGERGSVSLKDLAGNISSSTDSGIADLNAPDGAQIATNNLAGLTGTAESGSTVILLRSDGSSLSVHVSDSGTWSFSPNPLNHGEEATVIVRDNSGNQSLPALTGSADLVAPDAPVIEANNQLLLGGSAEVGGLIVVRLPDGSSLSTVVDETGRWSIEPNPLGEGESARVTVTDQAGNISRPANTGGTDVTAPDAPVVESNNTGGLAGTAEPESIITLTKSDGSTVTTVTDADGNWLIKPNPLADGEEGLVTATDFSENTSVSTSTGPADLVAPDAPVIETNNDLALGGSAEAGGTIVVTLPDGSTLTTVVDTEGLWALRPNPLDNGETAIVTVTDPAGNISEPVVSGVADITAPDSPVVESNNQGGLTGSAEPGSTITLIKPDGTTLTAVSDTNGKWAMQPNPLADGEEGKVTATDPSGNISDESLTGPADLIAPSAPVINTNNGAGLIGSAEAGGTIVVKLSDGTTLTTSVGEDGLWFVQPNPLTDGEYATVTVTDPAGNTSAPADTGIADITAPDGPIVTGNNLGGLTGTGEAGSTITLTKPDGGTLTTVTDANGKWVMQPNPLVDGEAGVVTSTDAAGNVSTESQTGAADLIAPDVPVIEINNEAGLSGSAEVGGGIVVKLPDGSTLTTTVDENGQWSIQPNPLQDGESANITVTDQAGNTSKPVNTGGADVIAPDAPIVESNNLGGLTGTGEAGSTITLTRPDGSTLTTVSDANGKWAMQPNPLADGEEGKVTATDPSGNTSGETTTGKADLVAPEKPVIENNNGNGLDGTGEAGGIVVVERPDGSTVTTTVDGEGNWSIQPNPLESGEKGSVTITDPSGNISEPTETGEADVTPPAPPVVENNNGNGLDGTGEAGGIIVVERPDGSTVTTIVDGEGNWSIQPNPLEDGEKGTVTITDPSGNISEPTETGEADVTPPAPPVVENNNGNGLDGTGEAGGIVVVERPDGSTVTTIVDGEGNWSIQPNPLEDGEKGSVAITDPSGNISEPTETGKADLIAPDAPRVSSNNLSGLTGSAEPDSTITLTKPDGSTVTTHTDKSGHWVFKPNPLKHGDEGHVTASDVSGNVSAQAPTGHADLIAPDKPIVDINNESSLAGSAEAGATVVVKLPGGSSLTTTVDEEGRWSIQPNPLDDGDSATVLVKDPAGNSSQPINTGGSDTVAPDAPVVTSNNAGGLVGTAEPDSLITLTKVDGSTVTTQTDGDGNWAFQPNPLPHGESGKVTAADPSGNVSAQTDTLAADLIAPDSPRIESNNEAGLSGSGEVGGTVIVELPSGSTLTTVVDEEGHWAIQPNPLAEGEQAAVTVADSAGNISNPTITGKADVIAPDAPVVESNNLGGLAGTGEAGSTITLTKPDGSTVTTVTDANGKWAIQPNPLVDGEQGKVTATDPSGNTSGETTTGKADLIAPERPVVENNNANGLDGTGEVGGIVVVERPDGSTVTTVVDGEGNWSIQPNPLVDGEEGKVTVTDPNGNTSGEITTGKADLIAPEKPVVENNNGNGLDGTGEVGGIVVVERPDGSTVTTVVDGEGNWSIQPNPLQDGETGSVTITDPSGNTSEPTETGKADLIKPDAPTVESNNLGGLTGMGEAGSTITLTKPDGSTVTTVTDANGKWSMQPNPLADGEEGKVTAADPSGNTSGETATGKADLIAPDAPHVDSNNLSGLTGIGEAGSTITLTKPDGSSVTTVADASGKWQFQPNPLPEGEKGHLTATDVSGNTGPETVTSVTDLTPPAVPVIDQVIDDQGNRTGAIANGEYTDDDRPEIVGSGVEAGALIRVYDKGVEIGSTYADGNGNWSFTPEAALTFGVHVFRVTATDAAGNPSGFSNEHAIFLQQASELADVAITSISDDTGVAGDFITSDTSLTVSGTLSAELRDGERVQVSNDGGKTWMYATVLGTTWSLADPTQHEGQFTYYARVADMLGNLGHQTEQVVVVDISAPEAMISIDSISDDNGVSSNDFFTNDNTLLVHGSVDRALATGEWIEVSADGSNWVVAVLNGSYWTADLQGLALTDGVHQLQARVVDCAANVGHSISQIVQIDTSGPDASGPDGSKLTTGNSLTRDTTHGLDVPFSDSVNTLNSDQITRDESVTVHGTLSHALQQDQYLQISLDGGRSWNNAWVQSSTQWSYALPAVSSSTVMVYHLRVIDNAGNTAANTLFDVDGYRVVIDLESPDKITAAPEITQALSSNAVHTFGSEKYGRVEAGALVSLVSDVNGNGTYQEGLDTVIGYAKADEEGRWSLSTTLPSGAQNLAFVVWDEAGNRSGMSAVTSIGVSEGDTAATVIEQSWGGTTDAENFGLNAAAVTLNQDGSLAFFQSVRGINSVETANAGRVYTAQNLTDYSSSYLAQPTIANGAGANVIDAGYGRYVNSAVFADTNRDGLADVMAQISSYGGAHTAYWIQNADGTYQPRALYEGVANHMGGAIAYDRYGDGYLDFVLADSEADSITFIRNEQGQLAYEQVTGRAAGNPGGTTPPNLAFLHEVSAVDLNNDGRVDIAGHSNYNGTTLAGNLGTGLAVLYNDGAEFSQYVNYTGVFRNEGYYDLGDVTIAMTWADFNGDGWLDLYLNRGSKNAQNSNENRIYLNDGQGGLLATDQDALWFGDNTEGATSLAMDWNHDGKMDVIEVPRMGDYYSPITGNLDLTLYLNQGNNVWAGTGVVLGTYKKDEITGAAALDYDWDGAIDLVLYRAGADAAVVATDNSAPSLLVKNNNRVADGTSMHVRILDQNGLNVFYSNTVKLYNSKGELVSTQIINPQTSGTSNSMGLVSFYGLDANETYSVQLLRIVNGVTDHVGAVAEQGGYTNATVNQNWGGLTTGKAHDAYVLTAESDTANNDTIGVGGIVGTGYNDTFFGSEGNDTFTGGAGWDQVVAGEQRWSANGGMDIVDYSRSANAINANLHTGVAVGQGEDKLVGIEGLIGTDKADTFTDNAANNLFEGRGGNDVFYLSNGGNDTLMYRLLDSGDGTGGNGHDTVYGFHIGDIATDADADLIDLSDLLDYSGPLSFYKGEDGLKLDHSAKGILDYLNVEVRGNYTVVSIDRDGTGDQSKFVEVVTLADTQTDLLTLLQNNQIMV